MNQKVFLLAVAVIIVGRCSAALREFIIATFKLKVHKFLQNIFSTSDKSMPEILTEPCWVLQEFNDSAKTVFEKRCNCSRFQFRGQEIIYCQQDSSLFYDLSLQLSTLYLLEMLQWTEALKWIISGWKHLEFLTLRLKKWESIWIISRFMFYDFDKTLNSSFCFSDRDDSVCAKSIHQIKIHTQLEAWPTESTRRGRRLLIFRWVLIDVIGICFNFSSWFRKCENST